MCQFVGNDIYHRCEAGENFIIPVPKSHTALIFIIERVEESSCSTIVVIVMNTANELASLAINTTTAKDVIEEIVCTSEMLVHLFRICIIRFLFMTFTEELRSRKTRSAVSIIDFSDQVLGRRMSNWHLIILLWGSGTFHAAGRAFFSLWGGVIRVKNPLVY